jgi:hypothetical protein
LAFGAGVAAATVLLARKTTTGESLNLDTLIRGCDAAASELDDRIQLAG